MKLISWNVNGIRACVTKGFMDFFNEIDADIFCIQESKMQEGQLELEMPGYYQYWNYAEKKGYSGTGRLPPILELCGEEGIFRNSDFYKERANGCEVWYWHRGTRPRGKSYNVGV